MSKISGGAPTAGEASCSHRFEFLRDLAINNGVVGRCTLCKCKFTAWPGTPLYTEIAAMKPRFVNRNESPPLPDWPEWMAPPRAAAYIDANTSTLAKLRSRGGGPVFCRIGKAIRYRRTDLDAWLLSTSRRSTSDKG